LQGEQKAVLETNLEKVSLLKRGKVRDVYDLQSQLLLVATDRISVYDVVLPTPIPDKGKILTQLSAWWFSNTKSAIANHLLSANLQKFPHELLEKFSSEEKAALDGRSALCIKTKPIPIEFVVRGYLSGSGWSEYRQKQQVCGVKLPAGLRESDKLPEPIFTPSTKAEKGHDENIDFQKAADIAELAGIPREVMEQLREKSIELYLAAAQLAEKKGIIIADTKFEFGMLDGKAMLIDEALTPDSSRFWPAESYLPGGAQKSFDKQYVRDYTAGTGWDKTPPGPPLPLEVVQGTQAKYAEAFERITGQKFA